MNTLTADAIKQAGGFVGAPIQKTVNIGGKEFTIWVRKESVGLLNDAIRDNRINGVDFGIARYCNAIVDQDGEPIFSPAQMEALTDEFFNPLLAAYNEVNPQEKKA